MKEFERKKRRENVSSEVKKMDSQNLGNELKKISDVTAEVEKVQADSDHFRDANGPDKLLTFLGHTASQLFRVASPEGVGERTRLDKTTKPITVKVGDEKKLVGYVKRVVEKNPSPTAEPNHLVVMNNGEAFVTAPNTSEDRRSYNEVMATPLSLLGVQLDSEGKISRETTQRMFTYLAVEKGVRIKSTRDDPETDEVMERTLGIDSVLRKHVAREYEPIVKNAAKDLIAGAKKLLKENKNSGDPRPPKKVSGQEIILPGPRQPIFERLPEQDL